MDCIECKMTNPDGNHYCGQCGAELGRNLEETIRKNGFRDRLATEMEITDSVLGRLMRWGKWLGSIAAIFLALIGLLLGRGYWDVSTVAEKGKTEIETSVHEGKKEIDELRQTTTGLKDQVKQLQSDLDRYNQLDIEIAGLQKQLLSSLDGYKRVDSKIAKLQEQFNKAEEKIVDLGKRGLRASFMETTGAGPSLISFGKIGCPSSALATGTKVAYCAQGSPLSLFQLTSVGELRPVSSRSTIGFQDVSTASKPTCTVDNRGTFYAEKGTGTAADKPFLCVKKSDNTYDWIQLGMVP
jgi:cell division protein FtsB